MLTTQRGCQKSIKQIGVSRTRAVQLVSAIKACKLCKVPASLLDCSTIVRFAYTNLMAVVRPGLDLARKLHDCLCLAFLQVVATGEQEYRMALEHEARASCDGISWKMGRDRWGLRFLSRAVAVLIIHEKSQLFCAPAAQQRQQTLVSCADGSSSIRTCCLVKSNGEGTSKYSARCN